MDTGSLETHHNIDELSKVIKQIVPPGDVILILRPHRLGPRVANLPNSPRPLKAVLSETAMQDLLIESGFHRCGSCRPSSEGTPETGRGPPET